MTGLKNVFTRKSDKPMLVDSIDGIALSPAAFPILDLYTNTNGLKDRFIELLESAQTSKAGPVFKLARQLYAMGMQKYVYKKSPAHDLRKRAFQVASYLADQGNKQAKALMKYMDDNQISFEDYQKDIEGKQEVIREARRLALNILNQMKDNKQVKAFFDLVDYYQVSHESWVDTQPKQVDYPASRARQQAITLVKYAASQGNTEAMDFLAFIGSAEPANQNDLDAQQQRFEKSSYSTLESKAGEDEYTAVTSLFGKVFFFLTEKAERALAPKINGVVMHRSSFPMIQTMEPEVRAFMEKQLDTPDAFERVNSVYRFAYDLLKHLNLNGSYTPSNSDYQTLYQQSFNETRFHCYKLLEHAADYGHIVAMRTVSLLKIKEWIAQHEKPATPKTDKAPAHTQPAQPSPVCP